MKSLPLFAAAFALLVVASLVGDTESQTVAPARLAAYEPPPAAPSEPPAATPVWSTQLLSNTDSIAKLLGLSERVLGAVEKNDDRLVALELASVSTPAAEEPTLETEDCIELEDGTVLCRRPARNLVARAGPFRDRSILVDDEFIGYASAGGVVWRSDTPAAPVASALGRLFNRDGPLQRFFARRADVRAFRRSWR